MSGAEAALIVGLISGTISIITTTKQVYDAARNQAGLPKAFRVVAERLSIVQVTLGKVEKQRGRTDEETAAVIKILTSCKAKSADLQAIFKEVLPDEGADRLKRYYKAVRTIGKGKYVEDLFSEILTDLQLLGGNSVAGLKEAIDALKAVEPSFVSEGGTNNNYGPGPQMIHNGPGDIHSVSGSGSMFVGTTQNFGAGAGAFGKAAD